jgi:hypothetical protein
MKSLTHFLQFLAAVVALSTSTTAFACQLTPLYGSALGNGFALQSLLNNPDVNQGLLIKDVQTENGSTVIITAKSVDESVCQKFKFLTTWRGGLR